MPTPKHTDPKPHDGPILFEEGDFHGVSDGLSKDPQYNDRRLIARRKLLALGKRALPKLAEMQREEEGQAGGQGGVVRIIFTQLYEYYSTINVN